MENIIANNEISFNSLEKDIFSFVCIMGQIMTKSIIEQKDAKLHKELKHIYENKGYLLKAISYYIDKDDVYNLDVILSHYNNEFYKETIYCCAQKMKPMRAAKFYKLLNGYKDSRNLYENIKKEKGILGKFL